MTRFDTIHLLADDAKLEKSPCPEPADLQPLPSRDTFAPRHVVSRLLAQFETFRGSVGHHRVTRFGPGDQRLSSQIPRYVGQNDQGPPVGADGPCWNRDGLCNPTECRRRESNPKQILRQAPTSHVVAIIGSNRVLQIRCTVSSLTVTARQRWTLICTLSSAAGQTFRKLAGPPSCDSWLLRSRQRRACVDTNY